MTGHRKDIAHDKTGNVQLFVSRGSGENALLGFGRAEFDPAVPSTLVFGMDLQPK